MRKAENGHTIAGAFVFLLLGIFAVSATVMVLLGVRFYRAQTQRAGKTGEYRILSSYVRTMARSMDQKGVLGTDRIDGVDMLTMTEDYDGWKYVTRIYTWDGSLREWFSGAEYDFNPEQGEKICSADHFTAEMENGLIHVFVESPGGEQIESWIAARSEGAGT